MDDLRYTVFELVFNYIKGKKKCILFNGICKEFKIISSDLTRRYYSAYLFNKIFLKIGLDNVETIKTIIDDYSIYNLIMIWLSSYFNNINCFIFHEYYNLRKEDKFNPLRNALPDTYRKIELRYNEPDSLLLRMALWSADVPSRHTDYSLSFM
jgi:hypothetical protein